METTYYDGIGAGNGNDNAKILQYQTFTFRL